MVADEVETNRITASTGNVDAGNCNRQCTVATGNRHASLDARSGDHNLEIGSESRDEVGADAGDACPGSPHAPRRTTRRGRL